MGLSTIRWSDYLVGVATSRQDEVFELVQLVLGLSVRMRQHFAARAEEAGLTPPQAHALRELQARPLPMGELAARLHVDASTLTGLTDRLEQHGLAERRPDPRDRRVKVVAATERGREAHRALWERLMDGSPVAEGLTREERRALRDLLRKLVPEDAPRC